MLVLSRRANEAIRFPQLGISVSIVSVKGNRVQVGVEAPAEIQILRKELESSSESAPVVRSLSSSQKQFDQARHEFKNRLNRAILGLHLAQRQLAAGKSEAAEKSLATALERLAELEVTASRSVPNATETSRSTTSAIADFSPPNPSAEEPSPCVDILLVEDDPNEQALMRALLEMEGYRVHTASNGLEAMKCLERITPQCVLLDMMMPECGGAETLERMRAIPSLADLPIYAVSGTSPESVGLSIGESGVNNWFPKPLNAPHLVKHMRDRVASLCT